MVTYLRKTQQYRSPQLCRGMSSQVTSVLLLTLCFCHKFSIEY